MVLSKFDKISGGLLCITAIVGFVGIGVGSIAIFGIPIGIAFIGGSLWMVHVMGKANRL